MTKVAKSYVAVVLDRSGSMANIKQKTIQMFNEVASNIQKESQASGIDTSVSLCIFSNRAKWEFFNRDSKTLPLLNSNSYRPDGMTALFDAVGLAVDSHKALPDANNEDTSFLVIVITDGAENQSTRYNESSIKRLLSDVQKTDRWSICFQVPNGDKNNLINRFGIPSDNVMEWQPTNAGMESVTVSNTAGITNLFKGYSTGKRSSANFYVTTNLSGLTHDQLKASLLPVTNDFRSMLVDKDSAVREFVQTQMGRNYVIGCAYYMLMKKELVQASKRVLVMEKGSKAIYGGDNARKLVGLPVGQDATVTPGNHSNYDIYVQSTSVNRRLPKGTRLLVDKTLTTDLTPTWDHVTVEAEAAAKKLAEEVAKANQVKVDLGPTLGGTDVTQVPVSVTLTVSSGGNASTTSTSNKTITYGTSTIYTHRNGSRFTENLPKDRTRLTRDQLRLVATSLKIPDVKKNNKEKLLAKVMEVEKQLTAR